MLAMDKLGAKLDRDYAGVVVSMNSSAYAVAGFDEDYLSASHCEIACSSQSCSPGAKNQNRMFARHAGNCNDQTTEWVRSPKGCEKGVLVAAQRRLPVSLFSQTSFSCTDNGRLEEITR